MQAERRGLPFRGRSKGGPVESITYESLLCFQVLNMMEPNKGEFPERRKKMIILLRLSYLY